MKKTFSALSELGQRTEAPPISWLMGLTLENPSLISLAAGFTDNPTLPIREIQELLARLLKSRQKGLASLQYGSTPGHRELRERTARHLQELDAGDAFPTVPHYAPNRILITNGSQQLLYILTEALCNPGDIVLVEDPTYFVYLGMAQSHGLQCRGIRMAEDGVDLDHLEEVLADLKRQGLLPRMKMIYLVSYFQNPSGRTTSFAKKTALLEILKRHEKDAGHPLYLLEDAAYRELRFQGTDIPSALGSGSERVIYAGTYSKPFATGARVGFGVLPKELFQVAERIKGNHDFGTSNLLQTLLAEALSRGHLERHLARLRRRYARKARLMSQCIREHFPEHVQWTPPTGGLYVWAAMPGQIKTGVRSRLFKAALDKNVLYVPGAVCYARDPSRPHPNHEMRISFGGANEECIRTGIRRLGVIMRQAL